MPDTVGRNVFMNIENTKKNNDFDLKSELYLKNIELEFVEGMLINSQNLLKEICSYIINLETIEIKGKIGYKHCPLCKNTQSNGNGMEFIKHNNDCPYIKAKLFIEEIFCE